MVMLSLLVWCWHAYSVHHASDLLKIKHSCKLRDVQSATIILNYFNITWELVLQSKNRLKWGNSKTIVADLSSLF